MLPAEPLRLRPPRHLVSRRAITWWTTQAALEVAAVLIPLAVGLVAWAEARSWLVGVTVAVVIIGFGYVLVMPRWRYRVHRWETTDDAVYTSAGWISQEWRVAPMSPGHTVGTPRGPPRPRVRRAPGPPRDAPRRTPLRGGGTMTADALPCAEAAL